MSEQALPFNPGRGAMTERPCAPAAYRGDPEADAEMMLAQASIRLAGGLIFDIFELRPAPGAWVWDAETGVLRRVRL
jgi:hypothetical protein